MKLRVRFLQLPVLFDAARLAEEVAAIPEDAWREHPKKFPGNHALPLITTDGDPSSDARTGAMAPTPHLLACRYLMQVLETLGATWGRSRLMRLSGNAEVTPHVDTDYYWRDHMRVHVPIVTQPTVRFLCGGEEVNMAAGECWIFDTWSLHSVHNDATRARIHLVADTVGGNGLLDLIENGRSPAEARSGRPLVLAPPRCGEAPELAYERCNAPEVMTPWELRDHLGFLLSEVTPGDAKMVQIAQTLNRLRVNWHALWARSGADEVVRLHYADLLSQAWRRLEAQGVDCVTLKNQMSLGVCLKALIFNAALSDASATLDGDERAAPTVATTPPRMAPAIAPARPSISRPSTVRPSTEQKAGPAPGATSAASDPRDPWFDRPVFIVSPPRSGSSLLFETLAAAPDLYTIGGESHALMEAIAEIGPAAREWESNRLTAADASPAIVAQLRERFWAELKDRDGAPPRAGALRMLEKTPKNALRIPFLAEVFPEARFVYLYRDPRPTLASMMEAWTSGRFRTYPQLPGWTGPPWSLLLVPGWRKLVGAPLNRIVAQQWASTTQVLLDDLAALPPDRWRAVRYDALIADPQAEIGRLRRAIDLDWDRPFGPVLPASRHTVSPPERDKWRAQEPVIEAVAAVWVGENERAKRMIETTAHPD